MNTEATEVAEAPGTPEADAPDAPVLNPFGPVVTMPTGAAATAYVQREVAKIQVSRIMARTFPRNELLATEKILTACARESLAERALYQYAKGGTDIEGASIHLAREMARDWGNIACSQSEIDRSGERTIIEVQAMDMETGAHFENRFSVRHWRTLKEGRGYPLTDDRDIYEHTANQASRRLRACILALLPADVVDAAVAQVKQTLATKVKLTPERLANMVKLFGEHGVTREMLERRVQRRLDSITPALFVQLSKIYNSIKDNMSAPRDYFDMPTEEAAPKMGNEGLKQKLAAARAKREPKKEDE